MEKNTNEGLGVGTYMSFEAFPWRGLTGKELPPTLVIQWSQYVYTVTTLLERMKLDAHASDVWIG